MCEACLSLLLPLSHANTCHISHSRGYLLSMSPSNIYNILYIYSSLSSFLLPSLSLSLSPSLSLAFPLSLAFYLFVLSCLMATFFEVARICVAHLFHGTASHATEQLDIDGDAEMKVTTCADSGSTFIVSTNLALT
jgi:hypothetical protein